MRKNRREIDGQAWISISRAAKLLGTNANGVRKLMGDGSLDWRQTRVNSRAFVVSEQDVLKLRKDRPPVKLKRSPDPLRFRRSQTGSPEPLGGGIFYEHHLRLTLPAIEVPPKPRS